MLQNEYLVAKIGVDTAENEPSKVSPRGGVQSGSYRVRYLREECHYQFLDAKIGVDTAENEPSKVWGMVDRFQKLDFRSQSAAKFEISRIVFNV